MMLMRDGSALDKLFSLVPKVKEAAAFGPVLAQRKVPVSRPEQEGRLFLFYSIYLPVYCVFSLHILAKPEPI